MKLFVRYSKKNETNLFKIFESITFLVEGLLVLAGLVLGLYCLMSHADCSLSPRISLISLIASSGTGIISKSFYEYSFLVFFLQSPSVCFK